MHVLSQSTVAHRTCSSIWVKIAPSPFTFTFTAPSPFTFTAHQALLRWAVSLTGLRFPAICTLHVSNAMQGILHALKHRQTNTQTTKCSSSAAYPLFWRTAGFYCTTMTTQGTWLMQPCKGSETEHMGYIDGIVIDRKNNAWWFPGSSNSMRWNSNPSSISCHTNIIRHTIPFTYDIPFTTFTWVSTCILTHLHACMCMMFAF